MDKAHKNIEEEVSKTLASLDGIEKATPKPFLHTRIMAKMEAQQSYGSMHKDLKPSFIRYATATLILLAIFNIFTITKFNNTVTDTMIEYDTEETFMDQYYPTLTTIENIDENLNE